MSVTGIRFYYALFFDDKGEFVKFTKFNPHSGYFTHKSGSFEGKYNIDLLKPSVWKYRTFLWDSYYYFYLLHNPDPILINKRVEPILNPELYHTLLETKVARELNDLAKPDWMKLMTPTNILIAVIAIAVIVYFLTGGTIT